jgi:hypothetical protein
MVRQGCQAHPGDACSRIRRIGPDHAQAGNAASQDIQQGGGPIAVLDPGSGDDPAEAQPEGIDEDRALAVLDRLPRIIAAGPLFPWT